jgi:hypothetical protein
MISQNGVSNLFVTISLLILLAIVSASAQRVEVPEVSQKAVVMQRIGLSDITITYCRPAVKGRIVYGEWPTDVKGEATLDNQFTRPKNAPLVPWGHVWRAGANDATVFAVNDDVLINGQPLPAGSYSLHTIPVKDGEWTIIFNKDDGQWGSFGYTAAKDALRIKSKPHWIADSQEMLTYAVDLVTEDSATISLRWEKAVVPFTVQVKDLSTKALAHLRTNVTAAKSDDFTTPTTAGMYAKSVNSTDDANKFFDQAIRAIDQRLKAKEDFPNLRQKSTILFLAGRIQEFIAIGEKAVAVGKAEKADTAFLEKRLADAKVAKP